MFKREEGFTLIEILVAMVVGGMVVLTASKLLIGGFEQFNFLSNKVEGKDRVQVGLTTISKDIKESRTINILDGGKKLELKKLTGYSGETAEYDTVTYTYNNTSNSLIRKARGTSKTVINSVVEGVEFKKESDGTNNVIVTDLDVKEGEEEKYSVQSKVAMREKSEKFLTGEEGQTTKFKEAKIELTTTHDSIITIKDTDGNTYVNNKNLTANSPYITDKLQAKAKGKLYIIEIQASNRQTTYRYVNLLSDKNKTNIGRITLEPKTSTIKGNLTHSGTVSILETSTGEEINKVKDLPSGGNFSFEVDTSFPDLDYTLQAEGEDKKTKTYQVSNLAKKVSPNDVVDVGSITLPDADAKLYVDIKEEIYSFKDGFTEKEDDKATVNIIKNGTTVATKVDTKSNLTFTLSPSTSVDTYTIEFKADYYKSFTKTIHLNPHDQKKVELTKDDIIPKNGKITGRVIHPCRVILLDKNKNQIDNRQFTSETPSDYPQSIAFNNLHTKITGKGYYVKIIATYRKTKNINNIKLFPTQNNGIGTLQ